MFPSFLSKYIVWGRAEWQSAMGAAGGTAGLSDRDVK